MKSTSAPVTRFDSVTKGYRGYVLALLTLVFIINFIDRQVLSVLIEPIKRELKLTDTQLGLLSDLGELFGRRTLVFIALAGGFQSMVTYGIATWLPAFFMRVHGMSASTAGTWLAIINGLVAGLGAIIGGSITARLSRDERRWLLWMPAMAAVISTPLYAFAVWSPSSFTSLLFLAPAAFLSMMYVGPALAATHGVAGVRLRATGVALTLFVSNLLGIGGGALLVGMVSDAFAPVEPLVSLRYGLLAVLVANVPAMIGYLLAARNVRNDWHE